MEEEFSSWTEPSVVIFFDIFNLVMNARYEPTVYKSSNNLNLEREIQFVSLERPQLEKAFPACRVNFSKLVLNV